MSTKRITLMVLVMVLVTAAVIAAVVISTGVSRRTEPVSLPPEQAAENRETEPAPSDPEDMPEPEIAVTKDTVRRVVATLSRSTAYSRRMIVGTYWEGGSSHTDMVVSVSGGNMALTVSGDREKHVLIANGSLYIWYAGDSEYYRAEATKDALRLADEYQKLITWEDIVSLPDGAVTDAGYEEYGGERCIFVRYQSGRLGYETICYISLNSGLVIYAESRDGDAMVYDMRSAGLETGEPSDSVFDLPDGTNALA